MVVCKTKGISSALQGEIAYDQRISWQEKSDQLANLTC